MRTGYLNGDLAESKQGEDCFGKEGIRLVFKLFVCIFLTCEKAGKPCFALPACSE